MKAAQVLRAACLAVLAAASATPAASRPVLASAAGGTVRAVVVGIDAYRNFKPALRGARADAADLADALKGGGADVAVFLDAAARRSDVVGAMDALVASSKPGDLAVVSFAGHGTRVPEYEFPGWKGLEPGGRNEEFVLAAYANSGPGAGEVIVNKEMKAWLARLDAKGVDVMFVADTCFGGGMARRFDARTQIPTMRGTPSVPRPEAGRFKPIPMTMPELLASVADMPRITFLGGADYLHEVPEVSIPGQADPRGALSYSVARMLRGEAVDGGTVTRKTLFQNVLQSVTQFSNGQQDVDREPKSLEPDALNRVVFRLDVASDARQGDAPNFQALPAASPVLGMAVLGGDASVLEAMRPVSPPFRVVERSSADVVWDMGAREVVVRGDVVRRDATPDEIPGILQRTVAIDSVKTLSAARPLTLRLDRGGIAYGPSGAAPALRAPDVGGRDLVAFDMASTGVLQVLYPYRNEDPTSAGREWAFSPDVVPPYGADQVVLVSAPKGTLKDFAAWAWDRDQRPAASLVPDRLRTLATSVKDVRIGTVDLVTVP